MTAKLYANPSYILDENFEADNLHPADIEQIIVAAYDEYEAIPPFTKLRKKYRDAVNDLITLLYEKRNFQQFSYLH